MATSLDHLAREELIRLRETAAGAPLSISPAENERYRALVEQAADGIFITDANGVYLETNDSGARLFGCTREQLVGRQVSDVVAEGDRAQLGPDFELLRSGETIVRERTFLRRDGTTFPGEISARRLSDGNIQGILRDITARKNAEQALRESRERLALIFANTSDVLALYHIEAPGRYRLVEVNRAFLEVASRRSGRLIQESDVIGQLFETLVGNILSYDAAALALSREKMERAIASGTAVHWEESAVRATGWISSERTDVPIFDEFGRCRHVLRVVHDITAQKIAEEALRASEHRFRSYFELPLIGVAISSPEKQWIAVNDKLCEILGYPRAELLATTWAAITHPDDIAANQSEFALVLAGQKDGYSLEKRFLRKNGTIVHTALSSRCVRNPDRSVDHFVTLVQDITDRKVAESERNRAREREQAAREEFTRRLLESQEAERRRIAAELHDSLGQNLLLIKNRVQLALAAPTSGAERDEQLARIGELVTAAIAEVRQISHDLRPYQLDQLGLTRALSALIDGAEQSSSIVFARKIEMIDDVFSPEAATQLYRVVQECLNNIFKHSQAQRARIDVERDVHHVRLWVEDDGRGLSGSRPGGGSGSGLGLQNIAERVRILGGIVTLGTEDGRGMRLEVIIPISENP